MVAYWRYQMGYGSKAGSAEGGSEASYNTEERERRA